MIYTRINHLSDHLKNKIDRKHRRLDSYVQTLLYGNF